MGNDYYNMSRNSSSAKCIETANIFSALAINTPKKLAKTDVTQQAQAQTAAPTTTTPWTLKTLGRSWADYEDEDEDEFVASFAPLPPLKLETVPELKEENEEEEEEEEEEDLEGPKSPLQKPSVPPPLKHILTKKEQRKRELAELDSVLAELGLSCALIPAKQWEKKEKEDQQQQRRPSLQENLRKVATSANTLHKGKKKNVSGSVPCKAAAAEVTARTAKVAAANKKKQSWSKQQDHYYKPK